MLSALWLSLLAAPGISRRPVLRLGLLAAALWGALLLVSASWPELKTKWTNSPLGAFVSLSPKALADRLSTLVDNPEFDPAEQAASDLLGEFDPGKSRVLVLLQPDLTTDVLVRANRGSLLPFSTPDQDILLPSSRRRVLRAVSRLPSGAVMLTDARYLAEPPGSVADAPLTEQAVWRIREQFALLTLRTLDGLTAVRLLGPRTSADVNRPSA